MAVIIACAGAEDRDGQLRSRLEGFFEATLNGNVVALDEYISDSCPAKAAYLEQAAALQSLEPVEVVVPDGAILFDIEEGVAVAKRSLDGLPVLVDGEPAQDDPASSIRVKLVLEEGVAVAKRLLEGPSVLVDGEPAQDDPVSSIPVKLVLEGNAWRVANCEAYVYE